MLNYRQSILKKLSNLKITLKNQLLLSLNNSRYQLFSLTNFLFNNQNLSIINLIDSKNKSSSGLKIFKQNLFDKLKENSYHFKNKLLLLAKKQKYQKHRRSMKSELIMAYLGDGINQEKTDNLIKTSITSSKEFLSLKNLDKQLAK